MGHSLFPSFRWVDFHVDICTSIHLMLPGNKQKEHVYSPLSISCQYTSFDFRDYILFLNQASLITRRTENLQKTDCFDIMTEKMQHMLTFCFWFIDVPRLWEKNTGIVVFNKNLKWNDHCVLSWWVIWTYCYTPPEIITCYKCIAFQYVVRRSLCLVV